MRARRSCSRALLNQSWGGIAKKVGAVSVINHSFCLGQNEPWMAPKPQCCGQRRESFGTTRANFATSGSSRSNGGAWLGHKRIEVTLNIYAHVLPSMQQDAAARVGALIHG